MTKERIESIRQSVIPFVKRKLLEINYEDLGKSDAEEFEKDLNHVLDLAIKALEQPTTKDCLVVDDCVSREQAKLDVIPNSLYTSEQVIALLDNLPPVTYTNSTCKDCKRWKDSDGVYRRGIGAESKCPINNSRILEGTFYCADFEKRGNKA